MLKFRSILKQLKDYVPGKSISEVKQEYGLEHVIKLASNENPLGPSNKAIAAMEQMAHQVARYPLGNSPELSQKLASVLGVKVDNICFGNGSDEIVWLLSTMLLDADDEVISSQPTFSEYDFCAKLMGAKYIDVAMSTDWNHELDEILKVITDKTKIIYICNPNNPTGTWLSYEKLNKFLDQVPPHVVVAIDQAYGEYAIDLEDYPQYTQEIFNRENLVLLRTFSKAYALAGLRIGYALANSKMIAALMKVKQPFNVNLMAQTAALAALEDKDHLQASLDLNNKSKETLITYLDENNLEYLDTIANFIAVKIGPDAIEMVKYLESQGMIIRSLKSFGMVEWVRISFGTADEMKVLLELLDKWRNS